MITVDRRDVTTLACRYGTMTVPVRDLIVGRSLLTYGEWAQAEIDLLLDLIRPGDTVVDVGANLGTHTLAFARAAGAAGRVIAFEPQPAMAELLRENVRQNAAGQVVIREMALGAERARRPWPRIELAVEGNFGGFGILREAVPSSGGHEASVGPLDDEALDRVDLVKIDVEGMELDVLEGARRTIAQHRPHVYAECLLVSSGLRLLEWFEREGYRVFVHAAPAYNAANFFGCQDRIFGLARETALVAIPAERLSAIAPVLDRRAEVSAVTSPDDLAALLVLCPRWGEPAWESAPASETVARLTHLLEDTRRLQTALDAAAADRRRAVDSAVASERRAVEDLRRQVREAADEAAQLDAGLRVEALRRVRAEGRLAELEAAEAPARTALAELTARAAAESARHERALRALTDRIDVVERQLRRAAVLTPFAAADALDPEEYCDRVHIARSVLADVRALFDEAWYLERHPDLVLAGRDPFAHFLECGGQAGRDPHRLFDSSYYLERYPDVRAAGLNPLLHFVAYGAAEGRDPHPLFHTRYYMGRLAEAPAPDLNPLLHYLRTGLESGADPSPAFNASFYLEQAPDCRADRVAPLLHYLAIGRWQGLDPHPWFDTSYYTARNPDVRTADLDPLSHFLLQGCAAGRDPHPFISSGVYARLIAEACGLPPPDGAADGPDARLTPVYDLATHRHVLSEYDRLRHDGRPVVLFVSHIGGGGTEKHVQELAASVGDRCQAFLLRPANHHVLGPRAAGLVALSPLGAEGPGLLFDPARQRDELVGILRGIGVERLHVHHLMGNERYLEGLVRALDCPTDLTIHDYFLLSPTINLTGADGRFLGEPDESASRLHGFGTGRHGSLDRWRRSHAWILDRAERVLCPSADTASRIGRYFPNTRLVAAAHAEREPLAPRLVTPPDLTHGRPLRVGLIGELQAWKGAAVVREVAARAAEKRMPIEFHLMGYVPEGALPDVIVHGRFRDAGLAALIDRTAPDVVWFPAQWPETYSYTLSAALRARLPVVVPDLGAFPERVGGRPWTWVRPWNATAPAWCALFAEVRERLAAGTPPAAPPVLETAAASFYPDDYLAPLPVIVAFTSIVPNYTAKARVLVSTLKRQHPELVFHLLLGDTKDRMPPGPGEFDAIVDLDDLGLADRRGWIFSHSVVELCTAIKGTYIRQLLARDDVEAVLYFDPDIAVLGSLAPVLDALDRASIVLVPHQTEPESTPDAVSDNELCCLRHGVFNLGFLGLRRTPAARAFADWWSGRLDTFCYDDIESGLFTDQRWVDLAPALFDDVAILRHPGLDVATWNLTHRTLAGAAPFDLAVNGEPLSFFHFSGFDSGAQLWMALKYGSAMPALFDLRNWYIRTCARYGQDELMRIPWSHAAYDNGAAITRDQRRRYRHSADLKTRFPDPFATAEPGRSYFHWFQQQPWPAPGGRAPHLYRM